MVSERKRASNAKWDAENTKRYTLKFMKKIDADIIKILDSTDKKTQLVRDAIRAYVNNNSQQ